SHLIEEESMIRRVNGRSLWLMAFAAFALAVAMPAAAQSTGMVRGVVLDAQGQPVDGAKINIDMTGGTNRHFDTKSNKKGEFVQIGLPPGQYAVTAEKDKQTSNTANLNVRIAAPAEARLVMGAGGPSKEVAAKAAELEKVFEEGVAASRDNADAILNQGVILWNAGNSAEAKKQFEAAVAANPSHAEAHFQLGMALVNEGNLPKAADEFETYLKLAPNGPNATQAKALVCRRSEEHTSELQSRGHIVCRRPVEKKMA